MKFPDPLIRGTLVQRYKRFLADVELEDGTVIVAHCPNPGSMLGLKDRGSEVWISPARDPKRKLRYTLELVRPIAEGTEGLVGVNTGHPNRLVEAAIVAGEIPELAGYGVTRREVKYGQNSRIDLLLEEDGKPPCYVEIKSVTLKRDTGVPGTAEFPDAVTARGTKHLDELATIARKDGARALMFYLVQREDCDRVTLAADIDPRYAAAFNAARYDGVEALCYCCRLSPDAIDLHRPLPMEL